VPAAVFDGSARRRETGRTEFPFGDIQAAPTTFETTPHTTHRDFDVGHTRGCSIGCWNDVEQLTYAPAPIPLGFAAAAGTSPVAPDFSGDSMTPSNDTNIDTTRFRLR
jgi:hypothetical protein